MYVCFAVFILLLSFLPPVGASTVVTQSPTIQFGNWFNPTKAYVSDNLYAFASRNQHAHKYRGYDFDGVLPVGCTIDKVEIGVEHYESSGSLFVAVSWDNEDTWSENAWVESESDVLEWIDATEVTDWTRQKLLDENLVTRVTYSSGGGCFHYDSLVTMANFEYETMRGLSKGDKILSYGNKSQPVTKYVEHEDFPATKFYNVTSVDGRSLIVYGDHEAVISQDLTTKLVCELTIDDFLLSLDGSLVGINCIEIVYLTEFCNIIVSQGLFYCEDFLIHNLIKEPFTAYLDWLPIRVTCSEVIDCNWIGVTNTVAGDPTEFKADFTDLNETVGLSFFRCLHNNTGTFENPTWSDAWTGNWSIIELTLNSTGDLTIAFRFYVNDTGGTEHESTWCFFPTYSPESEGGAGGYYYDPTGNILIDGFILNVWFPTVDLWFNHNPNVKGIFWSIILSVCIIGLVQQVFKHPKKEIIKVFQE